MLIDHCNTNRAGKMDFRVKGQWNTDKYCQSPWLTDQKKF